ncbi:hypothetical protein [Rosenbergiella collisarenosi]|uniref:hypothetical protein n=1 Tax=Rosenbergiella collisarenosi TaxID=1544695 RepID=UPI001F4E505A|nr:hypothetical protein [Rosenbergiella collisarenosi]
MDKSMPYDLELSAARIDTKAADFLCAIYHYTAENQAMPTTREIVNQLGITMRQGGLYRDRLVRFGLVKCLGLKRFKLDITLHSPLLALPISRKAIEDRVDKRESRCVQYLYSFALEMGCPACVEDMTRDLGISLQMTHKHVRMLESKGVIKLRKVGFRQYLELLINAPPIVPGCQPITAAEADILCAVYHLISPENPYVTVKELTTAFPVNTSTLSTLLTALEENKVIKRSRIGLNNAIEPVLPLIPVKNSVVDLLASNSKALSTTQTELLTLIERLSENKNKIKLQSLFEASVSDRETFIKDLARLEDLNKIITYRSKSAHLCFLLPLKHKHPGMWPTTEFKKTLASIGIPITAVQEQVLLFYENYLMKYGSRPPVLKRASYNVRVLAKKNVFVNHGGGHITLSKELPQEIAKLADIQTPYLSEETLEVLRQMKLQVYKRFSARYATVEATFEAELVGKRYVCPKALREQLFMTEEDLHKHLTVLRAFGLIKKQGKYYPEWDISLIYL